jgi:GMP synthase (glutamine-hydrolysing)
MCGQSQAMNTNSGTVSEALSAQLHSTRTQIAILDFGSQYSHLIARRIREIHVFCELYSCLVDAATLRKNNISGIILSGGPASVYDVDSPHVKDEVWDFIEEKKIPVLGICYGMQEMTHKFGGIVSPSLEREFGRAFIEKVSDPSVLPLANQILRGVEHSQMWMSHGDKVTKLADGFVLIATTANSEFAAFACAEKRMFGLQFHPEVTHSVHGKTLLHNFAVDVCKSPTDWNMTNVADEFIREVREKVGDDRHVIGAVSGGVDSSVAAVLMHRAIGDRFHAVMVDNGCLRKDESAAVVLRLKEAMGINLTVVDASERFLSALAGVTDPEKKRKLIGGLFIDIFQEEALRLGKVDFLLQGTLYPDVIESVSYKVSLSHSRLHLTASGSLSNHQDASQRRRASGDHAPVAHRAPQVPPCDLFFSLLSKGAL